MAAPLNNGTWQLNEEGWQYADKNGEYVDEKWCVSYGTQYWVNEDYVLGASEWVEEEASNGKTYYNYAQSDGSKAINVWKYLYAPTDDEEDGDQNWYYFDAKGRMVANEAKFQIGDYYYYFAEDGKMLTGWIDKNEMKKLKKQQLRALAALFTVTKMVSLSETAGSTCIRGQ
jgi:glucan-binding YG repeat protein